MLTRFVDWMFRDRQSGRIVIAQWPNLALWIVLAALLVERLVGPASPIGIASHVVMAVSLAIWALDEMLRGVNPWRRCLGLAVLVGLTVRLVA